MRLPKTGEEVDIVHTQKMVDAFMQAGFNYFDTAHGYVGGKSEILLKECLTSKYPRDKYILTNKLSTFHFNSQEEIRPLFESQLSACGVDYFDFYLMHAQDKELYKKFTDCKAYETAMELKKEGKFKHFGISFHDTADVLEKILLEHPEIEVVQIQFNYADYESEVVQSRKVYEMCRKHCKPVIVMEPVKGGTLANLPDDANKVFEQLGKSPANCAIRFAAGFEGVFMVLSGMSSIDMVRENTYFMKDFKPLDESERNAVQSVCAIFNKLESIPCTSCGYCIEKCPQNIPIPQIFSCYNANKTFKNWNTGYYYDIHTKNKGKASDCVKCGLCEQICPQHLNIRNLLEDSANEFERKDN